MRCKPLPLILIAILLLLNSLSFANIRRIGYWGNAVTNVDYTTADAAVTAAVAGDTIQVYPSSAAWSFSNLSKKLVIIGVGYYHYPGANGAANYNPNLQVAQPWSPCSISFYPGSDGSIITGCEINLATGQGSGNINNIKITNCRLSSLQFNQPFTYDGWEISKSEIYGVGIYGSGSSKITNLKIYNCIASREGLNSLSAVSGQNGIVENCTFAFQPNFSGQSFLVQNCIFHGYLPLTM